MEKCYLNRKKTYSSLVVYQEKFRRKRIKRNFNLKEYLLFSRWGLVLKPKNTLSQVSEGIPSFALISISLIYQQQ